MRCTATSRNGRFELRRPETAAEWERYHSIRERALWKGLDLGVYAAKPENAGDDYTALVLLRNGIIVGTLGLQDMGEHGIGREVEVRAVAVEPACQGPGYGRIMMIMAEFLAARSGFKRVDTWVHSSAVLYYAGNGYTHRPSEHPPRLECPVPDAIPMAKRLDLGIAQNDGSVLIAAAGPKFGRIEMGYKVAVVGATGNVGRELLATMCERGFPADEVVALASSRSVGREVSYGDEDVLKVRDLATFDFAGTDIVLSSPGATVSSKFSPVAVEAGAVVIDNTSFFRMEPDVPLVVPEVNPHAIAGYKKRGIIANPNCSTIQMVAALKPLHDLATIRRVVVATYQSVSGAGKDGMDELFNQTRGIYANEPAHSHQKKFTKQIAFNVIPHIDVFMDDGATKEEWKMAAETRKILDPDIQVTATCVRVPVFIGHAEAVNIEFEHAVSEDDAREALKRTPGIVVVDHRADEGYVTPQECAGEDVVYVSRIRKDPTITNGLNIWVVSDNLRKGAALNTVQIAEELIASYLEKAA